MSGVAFVQKQMLYVYMRGWTHCVDLAMVCRGGGDIRYHLVSEPVLVTLAICTSPQRTKDVCLVSCCLRCVAGGWRLGQLSSVGQAACRCSHTHAAACVCCAPVCCTCTLYTCLLCVYVCSVRRQDMGVGRGA